MWLNPSVACRIKGGSRLSGWPIRRAWQEARYHLIQLKTPTGRTNFTVSGIGRFHTLEI